jgi:hypothetical protein
MNAKSVLRTYILVALAVFAGNVYSEWERPEGEPGPAVEEGRAPLPLIATRALVRAVIWPLMLTTRSKSLEYRLLSVPLALVTRLLRRVG